MKGLFSEDDFQRIAGERRTIGAPKDFEKVLDVAIPADIKIRDDKIVFTPSGKVEIEANFEVDEKLKQLLVKPFGLPNEPILEPSSRMLIAIDDTIVEDTLGNLKDRERTYGEEIIKSYLLPAHEVDGHLDCCFNISRATNDIISFQSYIFHIHRKTPLVVHPLILIELNKTWHELRAILEEDMMISKFDESECKQILATIKGNYWEERVARGYGYIKSILEFLLEKSDHNRNEIIKVLDQCRKTGEQPGTWLFSILHDLSKGVDFEDLTNSWSSRILYPKDWSLDIIINRTEDLRRTLTKNNAYRAYLSTFEVIKMIDGHVKRTWYSYKPAEEIFPSTIRLVVFNQLFFEKANSIGLNIMPETCYEMKGISPLLLAKNGKIDNFSKAVISFFNTNLNRKNFLIDWDTAIIKTIETMGFKSTKEFNDWIIC